MAEKIRSRRLAWYGHVMRRDTNYVSKIMLSMLVEEQRSFISSIVIF